MENQANLGVWEDPHSPWNEQEPSKAEEHQGQGMQVKQGEALIPSPDQGLPGISPSQGPPWSPWIGRRLQGAALAHCWSVHPGSISSRASGGSKVMSPPCDPPVLTFLPKPRTVVCCLL